SIRGREGKAGQAVRALGRSSRVEFVVNGPFSREPKASRHMAKFSGAVTELIVQASSPDAEPGVVQMAARAVCGAIARASRTDLDEGVNGLADWVASAEMPGAAVIAMCCGAIVEQGGNPDLVLDAALSRLAETMMAAQLFAEACEEAAADHEDRPESTGDEDD